MKGLLLALAGAALLTLAVTVVFRLCVVRGRVALLVRLFLVSLPLFVLVYAWTPADLGVLPPMLVEPCPGLGLAYGLLVHGALFFGGLLQLYNLADRGFSLRILIDIAEAPGGSLAQPDLLTAYGGGHGFDAALDKRIDGLLEHGLIRHVEGRFELTPRGERAIKVYEPLQVFLRLSSW
ncbi:MAG: hypothetical protein DMD96_09820 [Candidatus Rokuibacteriota bacterium]|nr:MAG: hypothetical protein DMD96_09820 [Candidatus Rokubacteria bacterium]